MKNLFKRETLTKRFKYAWEAHRLFLAIVFIALLSSLVGFGWTHLAQMKTNWWDKWLSPATGLMTLIVAAGVWMINVSKEWEEQLPKRLTAIFKLENNNNTYDNLMICHDAHLASKSDIRGWGQQIGSQMVGERRLKFAPYLTSDEGELKKDDKGKFYKKYTITFYMKSLSSEDYTKDEAVKTELENIRKKDGLTWLVIHTDTPKIIAKNGFHTNLNSVLPLKNNNDSHMA